MATRLARAKVTESVIALILGHKRTSITSRYINPQWDEMAEVVEELAKICHRFFTDSENRKDGNSQGATTIEGGEGLT